MGATNMLKTASKPSIERIIADFPDLEFKPADIFYWSARIRTIYYDPGAIKKTRGIWQLLHEVAHATLDHQRFDSSIALLKMESEAWIAAKELAKKYNLTIQQTHIERCLDTYRDWLYLRSSCPSCNAVATEHKPCTFRCFNCASTWSVSADQRSRCYRSSLVRSP